MVLRLFNRKHVAQMLGVSTTSVDRLVRRGELSYSRRWAGGYKCFLPEQVDEYIRKVKARENDTETLPHGHRGTPNDDEKL